MAKIRLYFTSEAKPSERQAVDTDSGQTLMQAAVNAGISGIAADCGGLMTCATCHVHVSPAWRAALGEAPAEEANMLEFVAAERRPESRLSCQILLTPELDGLEVGLPISQY